MHILQVNEEMKGLSDQISKQQMLLNAEKNVGSVFILCGQSKDNRKILKS
jgi:hypothetical protein